MSAWLLQVAIRQRLLNYVPVSSKVSAVYDHVPQDAEFPYIRIGEDTAIDFDTDSSVGTEHTIHIHVWSRYRGKQEVKEIQQAVYDALQRHALPLPDLNLVSIDFEFSETVLDADGLTRHGVQRFRVLIDKE